MELADYDQRKKKFHRRLSSVFLPPQPPFLERSASVISHIVQPVTSRINCQCSTRSTERQVVPNCLMDAAVLRYELNNYRMFCHNEVNTTKYSLLTFIPKNLWEQFHRIANLYFVIVAGLNWIPALQAFNRYVGMIPVLLILSLTALKDAYEDYRRRRLDKQVNRSYCHVWDRVRCRFRRMQWRHIIVGDFIHLSSDDVIPADILLIRSSDNDGTCFVQTSNLDGETSLKQRKVPKSLSRFSGEETVFIPPDFRGTIFCEEPNSQIYQMNGRIIHENGTVESINRENVLLRGCQIRNTTFVEGIVLYAGKDTKALMSNSGPRYKRSSLEVATNRFIIYCVLILIGMCLFAGIASTLWLLSYQPHAGTVIFIILSTKSPLTDGVLNIVSAILNYQILIPLSLYISVELVKLGQIYFISQDVELYCPKRDRAMECRSLNIPEELGKIKYLLSDKTGTLTENVMVFRRCAINGIDYAGEMDPAIDTLSVEKFAVSKPLKNLLENEWHTNTDLLDFFVTMAICNTVVVNMTPRIDSIELGFVEEGLFTTGNSNFLFSLSTEKNPQSKCGTIERMAEIEEENEDVDMLFGASNSIQGSYPSTPTRSSTMSRHSSISQRLVDLQSDFVQFSKKLLRRKHKERKLKEMVVNALYEAESPDELALVYGARAYGVTLIRRSNRRITLALPSNVDQTYEILKILPFDSVRKKMSIIIREEDEIVLYCKGADSEILSSLSHRFISSEVGINILYASQEQLIRYSSQGLRTLCLAKRTLRLNEYERWINWHMEIESKTNDPTRERELQRSLGDIESNLHLLGVTAVEDRLQDGVQETISSLREAGIQVWVLTGDKMETAINIARACGLFPSGTTLYVIKSEEDTENVYTEMNTLSSKPYCIVLSATTLALLEKKHPTLLSVVHKSLSVLFYRMTPSNKADIVRIVKKHLKGKVLAIGDGANDVPMIQRADVGIGISGQEGVQAVMASDFAIARFNFLRKLLLVHGHWCYDRLVRTFLYYLYKNALFVFVVFWYQIYDGFTGTAPMDPIYTMLYPIIFTGVQPLVLGIYDQNAHRDCLLKEPSLYRSCSSGKLYRSYHFWINIMDALWQSVVIFFVALVVYWDTDTCCNTFGFVLATSIFLVNTAHLAVEVRCWTAPMLVVNIIFIFVHFGYWMMEGLVATPYWELNSAPVNVAEHALATMDFWAAVFLTTIAAVFPRFFTYTMLNTIWPSNVHRATLKRKTNGFELC